MAAKKSAKKAKDPTKASSEKPAKKAAAKKTAAKKMVKTVPPVQTRPPLEALARAAYLNYRRRVEQGLPGDSDSDWLEAEHQLSQPVDP
jgi:hypothetical protein